MVVVVRDGEERDLPALMDMIRELAAFEKKPDAVRNTVGKMEREKGLFGFFVAEESGRIIGSAIYFFAYYTWVGKSLYLDDLYVKPEYRGMKVGSMLLGRVFELARKEGCGRLRWQVLDWNKDAIAFYKKRGARISGEWLNCDFDEQGIAAFLEREMERK